MATTKGFIQDWLGNNILPITRGELVLDQEGNVAFNSKYFLAGEGGSTYGLVTAAEREMLKGNGSGGGISDIYAKLEIINNGFKVNGAALNFYNSEGTATPINFVSPNSTISVIAGANNTVNFSLVEVPNAETTVTQILKGIVVDKYGRVTSVTSAALTSADIPEELVGKKLKSGTLEDFKTLESEIGSDPTSVVNKAYVDSEIAKATGIAKGALKFGGAINDANTATGYLSNLDKWNSYYKVTADLIFAKSDFYETSSLNATGDVVKVKIGDTLIIYPPTENAVKAQFIYIPSGDELTAVTIRKEVTDGTVDVLKVEKGNIIFRFSDIFNVTNTTGSQVAAISIPKATSSTSGYLSSTDYAKFSSYATSLAVGYTGKFTSGAGVYEIGTLTVGTNTHTIYGKNTTYGLTLNNGSTSGSNQEYNPILKFTSTDANDVNITFKGLTSIKVRKNGDVVEIGAVNEVDTNSAKYLEFDTNNKLKAKIGSLSNNTIVQGLTDYEEFATFRSNVLIDGTKFLAITNSLKDTSADLFYGSTDLVTAITITI